MQKKHIAIDTKDDLDYLVKRSTEGPQFAESFTFGCRDLFNDFLTALKIDNTEFEVKWSYFDSIRKLHVSESQFGFVWISTFGLVGRDSRTENPFLNACQSQYTVVNLMFDKAVELIGDQRTFDVDGYLFGYLADFTKALFHNIIFYAELFAKAYLSLSQCKVPRTHSLVRIYKDLNDVMYRKKHNDSLFQAIIVAEFELLREFVESIPGGFKEEHVKYDDNQHDNTVILFDSERFRHLNQVITQSQDFIFDYYYEKDNARWLNSGLLQRFLEKAENDEHRKQLTQTYGYMIAKKV